MRRHLPTIIGSGTYLAAVAIVWALTERVDPVAALLVFATLWLFGERAILLDREEETRADIDDVRAELATAKGQLADLRDTTADLDGIRTAIDQIIDYLHATAGTDEPGTRPIPLPDAGTEPMEISDELAADAHAHVVMQQQKPDVPTTTRPTVERVISGHTFRFKEDA